jgi:hypothetical protein
MAVITTDVIRRIKVWGVTAVGAAAVGAAVLGLGAGTASAEPEELLPDPSNPSAGSAEGVRGSGDQQRSSTQGERRPSAKAVPSGTPMPVRAPGPGIGHIGI